MPRLPVRALGLALLVLSACSTRGCSTKGSRAADTSVTVGSLPPEPVGAAQSFGRAIATEKSGAKLAGLTAAFLDRLHVAVVDTAGTRLLVKGPISNPLKEVYLWEPSLRGLAEATVKGDQRRMTEVLHAYSPEGDLKTLADVDLGDMLLRMGKDFASEPPTPDRLVVIALAADLEARKEQRPDPRLDPLASMLLGLWLSVLPPVAAPVPTPVPTGPPPKLPFRIPPLKKHAAMDLSAVGTCTFMKYAGAIQGGLFGLGSLAGTVAGWAGKYPGFSGVMGLLSDVAKIPKTATEGIAGMGIAAFVDVDGDVKPARVRYGDGPAVYTVHVQSKNPFTQDQMNQFIDCLEAVAGVGAFVLQPLRDIPPPGPIANIPVLWLGTSAYDPKHGTFTPDAAAPSGIISGLIAQGVGVVGGSMTDSSGTATARFQVKPAKSKKSSFTKVESYIITAEVFPFPLGKSVVYGASNLISNREVPLRLEIVVPLPMDWTLTLEDRELATGSNVQGGWSVKVDASAPFTIGPDMSFQGSGPGTWTFGFAGGLGGVLHCAAPTTGSNVELDTSGKVLDTDTLDTHFTLGLAAKGNISSGLTCSGPGGLSVTAPLKGPASGQNALAGTGAGDFHMELGDGQTKTFPVNRSGGAATVTGTVRVTLTARDAD